MGPMFYLLVIIVSQGHIRQFTSYDHLTEQVYTKSDCEMVKATWKDARPKRKDDQLIVECVEAAHYFNEHPQGWGE